MIRCPSRMQLMLDARTCCICGRLAEMDQAFRGFFSPMCMAREDIRCNIDENLWPNPEDQADLYFVFVLESWVFVKKKKKEGFREK